MNRIFFVGDTHGTLDAGKLARLKERKNLDYGDYVIVCGDCGVVWSQDSLSENIAFYENLGCNVLYIDGNHENFDMLNQYPVDIWNGGKIHKISEHIFHLMRGQIFDILGKKIFALGGADSSDKSERKEHLNWWSAERITASDIAEAEANLKNVNYKVDYVITHTPSTKSLFELAEVLTQCGEAIPYFLHGKIVSTASSDKLDFIHKKVKYTTWFCGHMHIDEVLGNVRILYSNIVEIL